MSFRSRLLVGFAIVVIVPLGVFGIGIRRIVSQRVTAQYQRGVDAMVDVVRADVARRQRFVRDRLRDLESQLAADNRFRQELLQGADETRPYVIDYAGRAMAVAGLDMLELLDARGRIVSSGHFRNAYGLQDPGLVRGLAASPGGEGLVRARTAEGSFVALARVDSFRLGARAFYAVGGVTLDPAALAGAAPTRELAVQLVVPPEEAPAEGGTLVAGTVLVPFVESGTAAVDTAVVLVRQSTAALDALRRTMDTWFLAAVSGSALLALLLGSWLASRFSRPLAALAEKTSEVDLDRLDVTFESDRPDEIGALERLLGAMTDRLRASVRTLKEVERRAAVGDLARQVNHDIKNGLTPIRNVLRHLAQVANDDPAALGGVFEERRGTLESAVQYLETLASNYASLYPRLAVTRCDANVVVRRVLHGVSPRGGAGIEVELAEGLPPVRADELALRRVVENLVGNALDSLDGRAGSVSVGTATIRGEGGGMLVRLRVRDTGPGMTRAELDRAFGDFYTTKAGGTGLGLTIVRRLVSDMDGTLRVETEPGAGTTFTVELPAASVRGGEE